MSTLKTLTDAEIAKLAAVSQLAGIPVVVEDTADLTAEIATQVGTVGMVILIGIPSFKNESSFSTDLPAEIEQQILVRECPAVWRNNPDNIHCQVAAQMVAQSLQALTVAGFQTLKVVGGMPLGNIRPDPQKPISFQDYRLELRTRLMMKPI
jgi:hypothetical protein